MMQIRAQLTLCLTLFLFATAASAEALSVTASEWRPYVDPDAPLAGFAVSVVSQALERAGYDTRIETGPWPQSLEDTVAGKHDVFATLWFTESRAESLVFSEPYINNDLVFVRKADSGIRPRKREDLVGLRIGIVSDFAYAADADTDGIDIASSGSVAENIEKLKQGELDLVLADRRVALSEINEGTYAKQFDVLPEPLLSRGLRIGVSRQREDAEAIVDAFEKAIAGMREDGSFNAILATFRVSE